MRSKFSELIAAGIASFEHEPLGNEIPCTDPICRAYNNIWGVLTDTHMSCVDGCRFISGTFVSKPEWDDFLYAPFWGGCTFKGTGYCCLACFLSANHLCPCNGVRNGQQVICLEPCECDCACADPKVTSYTTSESKIPQPIARLGLVQECFNAGSLEEIAKYMNRSSMVAGDNWCVFEDKIIGTAFGKIVILEVNFDKGIKIENKVLAELLDNEGIGEFYYRQFPRYFALDSDDKKWQALLRRDENNKIFVKNFSDLTPQEWFEEAKAIITRYN